MNSKQIKKTSADNGPRIRLPREQRLDQLLKVSWQLISEQGSDALTLGKLAEAAGVSKPVVYDHFHSRDGLLIALYQDFDRRQTAIIDAAIAASPATLKAKAQVIASTYVDCVLSQGREIPDVLAALQGSPALSLVKRQYQQAFIGKCSDILAPFIAPRTLAIASLWAMLGAADALSQAVLHGDISEQQACDELSKTILAMVKRSQ